ncbi:MAG: hypothetical protein IJB86_02700 [Clostridia bacterium]|nr:hypothetical protein [Clostridia bacterium]
MKKRILAIILCLAMVISSMVITVSAEETEANAVGVVVEKIEAVKLKEDDSETVLQLALTVSAEADENEQPLAVFDEVNKDAQIVIYEGLIGMIHFLANELSGVEENFDFVVVAKAKPVSYADGILTLDVYSEDGTPGAKMITMQIDDFDGADVNQFIFELPEGLLKDSNSGKISSADVPFGWVEGLSAREVKLPRTVKKIVNAIMTDDFTSLIGTVLWLLPFAFIAVPILISIVSSRLQDVYDIYDMDVKKVLKTAWKNLKKAIPNLIGQIF